MPYCLASRLSLIFTKSTPNESVSSSIFSSSARTLSQVTQLRASARFTKKQYAIIISLYYFNFAFLWKSVSGSKSLCYFITLKTNTRILFHSVHQNVFAMVFEYNIVPFNDAHNVFSLNFQCFKRIIR